MVGSLRTTPGAGGFNAKGKSSSLITGEGGQRMVMKEGGREAGAVEGGGEECGI